MWNSSEPLDYDVGWVLRTRNEQTLWKSTAARNNVVHLAFTGQLYNYNSQDNTKFVYTTEGPAEDDDSYMGTLHGVQTDGQH